MNNSRYTVALHILTILTMDFEGSLTSGYIAQSVNTNPVVIRRILGSLRKAGMVTSKPGVGGGIELNQAPESITLLDVYRLFKQGEVFPMHSNQPSQHCPCGANIQTVLGDIYDDADKAMETIIGQKTLADLAAETWQAYHAKKGD